MYTFSLRECESSEKDSPPEKLGHTYVIIFWGDSCHAEFRKYFEKIQLALIKLGDDVNCSSDVCGNDFGNFVLFLVKEFYSKFYLYKNFGEGTATKIEFFVDYCLVCCYLLDL